MTLVDGTHAEVATQESPGDIASAWLARLEAGLAARDVAALAGLFTSEGTWRDQLAFQWDFKNWVGADEVASAMSALSVNEPRHFRPRPGTAPQELGAGEDTQVIAFYDFETATGPSGGVVQLVKAPSGFVAAHLLTQLEAIKGHEWQVDTRRPEGRGHGAVVARPDPAMARASALAFDGREPQVVVVGAGHNGLMVAARLERLGIDALVLDQHERVGDNWRHRYASLALHNYTSVNDFAYMPFPSSFPKYLPRDVLADFMEYYARAMFLKVWTGTRVESASYSEGTATWDVHVRHADGSTRTLHPAHLVMATGLNGKPVVPDFPGMDEFHGEYMHSEKFGGGQDYAGKKVVVLGAGVSGHDVAQDLYEHGVDVTLVQRSSTYVVDVDTFHSYFYAAYMQGAPVELADTMTQLVPLGVLRERGALVQLTSAMAEKDKEILDDLRAAGFGLNFGPDGKGMVEAHFNGKNGYYFDIGTSRLIADGLLRCRTGVAIDRFTQRGVVLTDGSELDADVVVAATGYTSPLDAARDIIGDEAADKVGSVWRWGDDREITGAARKSGQPGLWFMTGTIVDARVLSKFLALQILGVEVGLDTP